MVRSLIAGGLLLIRVVDPFLGIQVGIALPAADWVSYPHRPMGFLVMLVVHLDTGLPAGQICCCPHRQWVPADKVKVRCLRVQCFFRCPRW